MSRLCLVALLIAAACKPAQRTPEIGDKAPPYQAMSLTGDSVSVASLAGKVVLLNVWATWCAPCREEIPFLQSLHDSLNSRGLAVIGVSVDARGNEETIRGFSTDFQMTYPIWRDPEERIQSLYMALGVPASYLIDRTGVLRWKRLGIVRPTDTLFVRALDAALGPIQSARR